MVRVRQPLKWFGGKYRLAPKIVALMPAHTHYVEPYAGGLAVLFAKPYEGVSEVVNDLDGELINFWRMLQQPESFELLKRRLEATPVSREEWEDACEPCDDPIERTARLLVRYKQSFSGRGSSFGPATKSRTRGGMNEETNAWIHGIAELPAAYERLRRVFIENRPAVEVIEAYDAPHTLFYCDPPYLRETRVASTYYTHEMTAEQHKELLNTLLNIEGKFILSGYPSDLYDGFASLAGWNRVEIDVANQGAAGLHQRRMTEVLWFNYSLEELCTTQSKTAA